MTGKLGDQGLDTLERRFQALRDQIGATPEPCRTELEGALQELSQAIAALQADREAGESPRPDPPGGREAQAHQPGKKLPNQLLLDALPCVALLLRPGTREIVAANAEAAKTGALPGAKCFSTWGKREDPCPWCLAPALWATGEAQHLEVEALGVTWEAYWIPVAKDLYMHFAFDVTARKQVESSLREREVTLRTLIEANPESLFLLDTRGVILAASRVAARRLGKSLKDIIGTDLHGMLPPEVSKRRLEIMQRVVATGQPARFEDIRGDFSFDSSITPIFDQNKVVQIAVLGVDITDRKNAEQALKESEERFRMLFDYAPDAYCLMDLQGNFLDVNQGAEALTGYGREQLIGRNYQDLSLFDEGQNSLAKVFFQQAVNGKILGPVEFNLNRKDGGNIVIEAKGLPLRMKGEGFMLGIVRDITARKQAEAELRESERRKSIRNEILQIFLTASDENMYNEVLQVILRAMESRFGVFAYKDEHGALVAPSMTRDIWEQCQIPDKTMRFPPETWGDNIWARAIRQKRSLWKNEPGLVPQGHVPIENVMVVPLLCRGEVFAHFEVANKPGGYAEADKVWLEDIAQFIAPVLHARLERNRKEAERQQAEAALKESEARFRHISSTISDISYSCSIRPDGSHKLDWLAGAVERITGYSVEEIMAQKCWKFLVIEADQSRFEGHITGLVPGTSGNCELRLRHKNGEIVWVASFAKVVQGANQPELLHLYGGLVDITAHKQAEEALKVSEERYRMLFEAFPDAVSLMDIEMNVIMENPCGVQLFGTEGLPAGASSMEFVAPEDRLRAQEMFTALLKSGKTQTCEITMRRRDGSRFPGLTSLALIRDAAGRPQGIVGIARDITALKHAEAELRQSEQRFRLMAETIQDVFWIATRHIDKTVYVSPGFEYIWGRTSKALYRHPKLYLETVHPEDRERVRSEIIAARKRSIPWSHEYRINRPDGTVRWIQNRGFPVRDDQGRVILFTGVATDITGRKALEGQLFQAQKMEAVGRLAGGVAHDFNNLLMAIMGYGELMRAKVLKDDPLYGHLENILKAGERAAALTQQLLTFSRRQIVHPQVIDLNRVVLDLEPMLRRLIGEDLHLEVVTDRRSAVVKADPGQMGQIIMNLVVNARDAMPQGGRLALKISAVDLTESCGSRFGPAPPGAYVRLEVQDTGVGMDEATQAHVFEPFFTTKEPGKGTGLGLSTVYGIVKQSGGYLDLESSPGAGSTFIIYLPRLESIVVTPKAKIPLTPSFQGEETILLVEDEDMLRGLLAKFLRLYGYTVLEASHGGEALLACERHPGPIHLMVTDVVMPQMSGRELADRLNPLRPEMKMLYMSGYTEDALVRHGVADASVVFLQKPFRPIELARRVHAVLHPPVIL